MSELESLVLKITYDGMKVRVLEARSLQQAIELFQYLSGDSATEASISDDVDDRFASVENDVEVLQTAVNALRTEIKELQDEVAATEQQDHVDELWEAVDRLEDRIDILAIVEDDESDGQQADEEDDEDSSDDPVEESVEETSEEKDSDKSGSEGDEQALSISETPFDLDEFRERSAEERNELVFEIVGHRQLASVKEIGDVVFGTPPDSGTKQYQEIYSRLMDLHGADRVNREREENSRTMQYRQAGAAETEADHDPETDDDGSAAGSDTAPKPVSPPPPTDEHQKTIESTTAASDAETPEENTDAGKPAEDEDKEEADVDYAKTPIPLRKALNRKKKGHYFRCADCEEDFERNARAKEHRDEEDHDNWLVRYKSLREAGVYRRMDD